MLFKELGLRQHTLDALQKMGYEQPTEVQEKVIPLVMAGKNVLTRSKTGTGKTAAFGIGIVERIAAGTARKALVLTPTRELCMQVAKELRGISANFQFKVLEVYGGVSINPQIDSLKRGVEILIATPGRLLDHAERHTVDLSQFDVVVLDEADRMLDMGFRDEMDEVMYQVPKERTVLLLSATLEPKIIDAASRYMAGDTVTVEVGEKEKPAEIVEHHVEATQAEKFSKLKEILREHSHTRAIIFTSTKFFASKLAYRISEHGFRADCLQGDMSQAARERVLMRFKEGDIDILVATDVAARGLHIENVGLIINYDKAQDDDTHLHRVGRTGRMGAAGKAITFTEKQESHTERFSEDHPDFAWMRHGYGNYSSSREPRREGREGERSHHGTGRRGPPHGHSSHSTYRAGSRDSGHRRGPPNSGGFIRKRRPPPGR